MSILVYLDFAILIYRVVNRFSDFRVFRAYPTLIIHIKPYNQGFWEYIASIVLI